LWNLAWKWARWPAKAPESENTVAISRRDGDHDEESNKNLLTFSFHLYLLFP